MPGERMGKMRRVTDAGFQVSRNFDLKDEKHRYTKHEKDNVYWWGGASI